MEFLFKDIPEGFFKAKLSGDKEGKWSMGAISASYFYHYRGRRIN